MWIFRYLRADRVDIGMGPYDTEEEAQEANDWMACFEALCTGPIEVEEDYKLYKGKP